MATFRPLTKEEEKDRKQFPMDYPPHWPLISNGLSGVNDPVNIARTAKRIAMSEECCKAKDMAAPQKAKPAKREKMSDGAAALAGMNERKLNNVVKSPASPAQVDSWATGSMMAGGAA